MLARHYKFVLAIQTLRAFACQAAARVTGTRVFVRPMLGSKVSHAGDICCLVHELNILKYRNMQDIEADEADIALSRTHLSYQDSTSSFPSSTSRNCTQ